MTGFIGWAPIVSPGVSPCAAWGEAGAGVGPQVPAACAEMPAMQSFFLTLGYGLIALLAVSVLVAWWEHVHRSHLLKNQHLTTEPLPARACHVDVNLDALPLLAAAQDQAERKAMVDAAMARMVRSAGMPGASSWTETRPMVGPGVTRESEPT